MDWSSVYEENGDESGDFSRVDNAPASVRTSILDSLQVYNPYVCYAFTVNYILGVGCLGIPNAFYRSGIVLGSALIIFLSFISYTTVMWIAETSHRGMQLRLDSYSKNPFRSPKLMKRKKIITAKTVSGRTGFLGNIEKTSMHVSAPDSSSRGNNAGNSTAIKIDENKSLVQSNATSTYSSISQLTRDSEKPPSDYSAIDNMDGGGLGNLSKNNFPPVGRVRSDTDENDAENVEFCELEVTELTLDILGPKGFVLYQGSLAVLTYVGLLAYTQVFIQSFTSEIWPGAPSAIPNLIFGLLVVPLSCCDLAEQITAQVLMSLLRFFSFGILIVGILAALYIKKPLPIAAGSSLGLGHGINGGGVPLADFSGFGVMFTTAIFSQIFPHIVPGLIRPLAPEDKKYVPRIFFMALVTTSAVYISIGCICVVYFRENIKESVNLNFIGFASRLVDPGSNYEPLLSALAMVVVLFPAVDTLSVYPLIANTLGNNLNVAFPFLRRLVRAVSVYRYSSSAYDSKNLQYYGAVSVHGVQPSERKRRSENVKKITVILWRLVAATPPVICSHFVTDLSVTLQFAGLCGVILALIIPALLQKYSHQRIASIPVSLQRNPYSSWTSGTVYTDIVLGIATVAFMISILQMV